MCMTCIYIVIHNVEIHWGTHIATLSASNWHSRFTSVSHLPKQLLVWTTMWQVLWRSLLSNHQPEYDSMIEWLLQHVQFPDQTAPNYNYHWRCKMNSVEYFACFPVNYNDSNPDRKMHRCVPTPLATGVNLLDITARNWILFIECTIQPFSFPCLLCFHGPPTMAQRYTAPSSTGVALFPGSAPRY